MNLILQIKGTKPDGTTTCIYPERSKGKQSDVEIKTTAVGWRNFKEKCKKPFDSPFVSISLWSHGEKLEEVPVIQPETEIGGVPTEMQTRIKELYRSQGKGTIFVSEESPESGDYTSLKRLEEQARLHPGEEPDPFQPVIDALKSYDPISQYVLTIAPADKGELDVSTFDYE